MIPKKRTRPKMNVRQSEVIRCPQHLAFVRQHECAVNVKSGQCDGQIEAAHVRLGTDGSMGKKPSDCWTVPLCRHHHAAQHNVGEVTFWGIFVIDPRALAKQLWDISPAGKRYRAQRQKDL